MRDLIQNVGNVLTIQHQTCVDEIFKRTIFVGYGGVIFFTGVPPYAVVTCNHGLPRPGGGRRIAMELSGASVSPSHFYYGAAPCPFSPAPCPFSQRHALFLNLHSVPYILVKSLSKSDKK